MNGYRVELQDTERSMAEMVTASMAIRNVGQGVGAVLAPFGLLMQTVVAAIIAKEGVEWFTDQIDELRNARQILSRKNYDIYVMQSLDQFRLREQKRIVPGKNRDAWTPEEEARWKSVYPNRSSLAAAHWPPDGRPPSYAEWASSDTWVHHLGMGNPVGHVLHWLGVRPDIDYS